MSDEPTYGNPEPEPEHEPWNHEFRPEQNWSGHWNVDGKEYISKTQACSGKEFNLTKKEFKALLAKVDKEKLQLRTRILQNEQYGNEFTVYNVDDLKKILGSK